ncbi:hypothetical protein U9M48_036282 [Paspalum notatum var. saurae]|uniref:Uncharacterized protein n=1 Tax=Paspalum notatum var. saurae TaxID=547442 RepID=A0AAQ3XAY8_PASNO
MPIGTALPLHGANTFWHQLSSCDKPSGTRRMVRDLEDKGDYARTRERSALLQDASVQMDLYWPWPILFKCNNNRSSGCDIN